LYRCLSGDEWRKVLYRELFKSELNCALRGSGGDEAENGDGFED
jgi:hypothetical protein